jgi:hypothetical protein
VRQGRNRRWAALLSDVQFWIPLGVFVLGAALLQWLE